MLGELISEAQGKRTGSESQSGRAIPQPVKSRPSGPDEKSQLEGFISILPRPLQQPNPNLHQPGRSSPEARVVSQFDVEAAEPVPV